MKKLLLIPVLLALTGCPPPRYVEVYNNSGAALFIYGRSGMMEIDVGRSKDIPFPQFIHHRADFTQHVQVEPNGDILFLGEGVGPPAPVDLPQPPGFPLQGKIPEWTEKK